MLALSLAMAVSGEARAHPIAVFVSILPQKDFVERIAGRDAKVFVMVGPGDSPATYDPNPRQIAALSRARVYFEIGVPFERAWMARLHAANPGMLLVDTASGIRHRNLTSSSEQPPPRFVPDPHVWTSPDLVKAMAARIEDTFERLDPAHAETYKANYRKFASDLDALNLEIRKRLSPFSGGSFLVFHASWGYFADAYGLKQIAIEAEGREPGPRALVEIVGKAKSLGIKTVFVQPQFSRANAEMIAREIGGRVVELDPLAENYIDNMRHVAASIAEAMRAR